MENKEPSADQLRNSEREWPRVGDTVLYFWEVSGGRVETAPAIVKKGMGSMLNLVVFGKDGVPAQICNYVGHAGDDAGWDYLS